MIAGIKEFFSQFIAPAERGDDPGGERALQVATAALLVEMMRMDRRIDEAERVSVVATLRREFGLDEAQLAALLALAEEEASQASGYHQFTTLINKSCDAAQKVRIVENLWRVAMADGHLDAHETHLMRRIAGLLHVGHADYVAAKRRAREATGLAAD